MLAKVNVRRLSPPQSPTSTLLPTVSKSGYVLQEKNSSPTINRNSTSHFRF
jgi:hypothetical protein